MYNLIECSDSDSKTYGNVWQYFRDEPHSDHSNHSNPKQK